MIPSGLEVLSAMITPAVLISASGTLVLSTSVRLARVVDRVRALSHNLEEIFDTRENALVLARRAHVESQLEIQTRRGRLIQRALTSFYLALCVFVGTTISIAVSAFAPAVAWAPTGLGIFGMIPMFYGCVLLVHETRLALVSVDREMAFALGHRARYEAARGDPGLSPGAGPATKSGFLE